MTVILIQLSTYGFLMLFDMLKSVWGISRAPKDIAQDFCPSGTTPKTWWDTPGHLWCQQTSVYGQQNWALKLCTPHFVGLNLWAQSYIHLFAEV